MPLAINGGGVEFEVGLKKRKLCCKFSFDVALVRVVVDMKARRGESSGGCFDHKETNSPDGRLAPRR